MAGKKKVKVKAENEAEQLKRQLARALADYDNLRKRVEREREEYGTFAKTMLMAKLLSVYDMLEGAQNHLKDSGLAITIEEFVKVLEEEGIEKIEVGEGEEFNEELHEAVEAVDKKDKGKKKEGEIKEVILTGWKIVDGPVIRPAKVKVYKK